MDIDYAIHKIVISFFLEDGSNKILETVIDEKKKLQYKYEDAVATGKTAVYGTLTKTQKDMMRINIGNFPARSEALLKIFYHQ
jgi:hypothetical protein